MEGKPLVSVCMTAYNHERYIAAAIESILSQRTSFPFELVIGEDCSTDRTAEICREYERRNPGRVRIVTSGANVGWRENYRRTFAACRGEFVAVCDGDDRWCDDGKMQMQADLLLSDSGCGMCYTRSERREEDGEGNVVSTSTYPVKAGLEYFDAADFRYSVENCTAMARRGLVERYYAEVRPDLHPEWLTDDLPMWLWFAANSRCRFIDRTTAVRRILRQSVSHSDDYRRNLAFCDSIEGICLWFDARYGGGRRRMDILRRRQSVAAWVLSYHGSVGDFVRRWLEEVRQEPRLLTNAAPYGLFIKKIAYRMWKKPSER